MKKWIVLPLMLLAGLTNACSKHECELETDSQKEALGPVADMTQGAFSCRVQGASAAGGMLLSNIQCEIGKKDCVPMLEVTHGDGADVKSVADGYRKWLKANKWEIKSDEAKESKAMNGNTLKGVELKAENGDKALMIRLFPFGEKLVQGRVMLLEKDKLKS